MSDLPRITDALVRCYLCDAEAPVIDMTMTDDELWECDDTEGCQARQDAMGWAPAYPRDPVAEANIAALHERIRRAQRRRRRRLWIFLGPMLLCVLAGGLIGWRRS